MWPQLKTLSQPITVDLTQIYQLCCILYQNIRQDFWSISVKFLPESFLYMLSLFSAVLLSQRHSEYSLPVIFFKNLSTSFSVSLHECQLNTLWDYLSWLIDFSRNVWITNMIYSNWFYFNPFICFLFICFPVPSLRNLVSHLQHSHPEGNLRSLPSPINVLF